MERDVTVERIEKREPFTNQDGQDRITDFVGEPAAKAFGANHATANKPDAAECWPQTLVHQLRKITRVELDRISDPR
ncbi:MAG: hypothetical protein ABMA00_11645 [Gemmatimonas sp.]